MLASSPSQLVNPFSLNRRAGFGTGAGGGGVLVTLPSGIDFTGGAVYALNRVVSGYSGNTVELWKSSPGYASFGFTSTGEFDAAAVLSWASGSLSGVEVARLYDQSGNGYNTNQQTTSANRPLYQIEGTTGKPAIWFGDADASPQRYLVLPTTITQAIRNMTLVIAGRASNEYGAYYTAVLPTLNVGSVPGGYNPTDGMAAWIADTNTLGHYVKGHSGIGGALTTTLAYTSRVGVHGVYSTGSGVSGDSRNVAQGGRALKTTTGAVGIWPGQVPTGGRIGCQGDGAKQLEGWVQSIVLARGGSTSQLGSIRTALNSNHGLRTGETRVLWLVGDSLSSNYVLGYNFKNTAFGVELDGLQSRWLTRVFAAAGTRIDQQDTAASNSTTGLDPWASELGAGTVDCFLWSGHNDLNITQNGGAAASLATMQSRASSFVTNRKAAGISKVYAGTILLMPSGYVNGETVRQQYNAWLTGGSSPFDGVCDLAALDWTGLWQADNTHLTAAGNTQVAAAVASFLALQP